MAVIELAKPAEPAVAFCTWAMTGGVGVGVAVAVAVAVGVGVGVGVAVAVDVGVGVGVGAITPKFQALALDVRTTMTISSPTRLRLSTQGSGSASPAVLQAPIGPVPSLNISIAFSSVPPMEVWILNSMTSGAVVVAAGAVMTTS